MQQPIPTLIATPITLYSPYRDREDERLLRAVDPDHVHQHGAVQARRQHQARLRRHHLRRTDGAAEGNITSCFFAAHKLTENTVKSK